MKPDDLPARKVAFVWLYFQTGKPKPGIYCLETFFDKNQRVVFPQRWEYRITISCENKLKTNPTFGAAFANVIPLAMHPAYVDHAAGTTNFVRPFQY